VKKDKKKKMIRQVEKKRRETDMMTEKGMDNEMKAGVQGREREEDIMMTEEEIIK
jgi:hypothetical protein